MNSPSDFSEHALSAYLMKSRRAETQRTTYATTKKKRKDGGNHIGGGQCKIYEGMVDAP